MRNRYLLMLALLFVGACAPKASIEKSAAFAPTPSQQPVLVMPVASIMCPQDVSETFFDRLIQQLNGSAAGYRFVILKQDPASLPPEKLAERSYLTGEIFGCLEDTGCCSGEIIMTIRLELFQPGQEEAVLRLRYPAEPFFDPQAMNPVQARISLAAEMAERAAADLLSALRPTP